MALLAAVLPGCDRGSAKPAASPPPSDPASAAPRVTLNDESPATIPSTEPAVSTLTVGAESFTFPPAVLRLTESRGHVIARLMTDDPPEAINEDYRGNSFDLIMSLNIADPQSISGAEWKYIDAAPAAQDESAHGIFLDGQRRRLHPQNVTAQFESRAGRITVRIWGTFLAYDSTPTGRAATPQKVMVQGKLETSPPEK